MNSPNLSAAVLDTLAELTSISLRVSLLTTLFSADGHTLPAGRCTAATLEALERDITRIAFALEQAHDSAEEGSE